jgi:hypothetical protein
MWNICGNCAFGTPGACAKRDNLVQVTENSLLGSECCELVSAIHSMPYDENHNCKLWYEVASDTDGEGYCEEYPITPEFVFATLDFFKHDQNLKTHVNLDEIIF